MEKVYHTSRLKYLLIYILIILILTFSFLIYKNQYTVNISIILSVFLLIITEITVRSNDLIIGDKEVINEIGVLSKKRVVIHYSNITDITFDQGFIQRIFGIGDVHINTGGSQHHEIILKSFSNVNEINNLVLEKIRGYKRNIKY